MKNRLSFPTSLQFEPIQLCNASCYCCPYSWLRKDKEYLGKKMPKEKIIDLIKQFGQPILENDYPSAIISPWRYSDPLVCPDLRMIFEESVKYNLKIKITTNAVSLNDKNVKLLEEYLDHLFVISISIIGSTQEEVKKYMGVDLNKTLEKLKIISEKKSPLLKQLRPMVKHVSHSKDETKRVKELVRYIKSLGINYNSKVITLK